MANFEPVAIANIDSDSEKLSLNLCRDICTSIKHIRKKGEARSDRKRNTKNKVSRINISANSNITGTKFVSLG